ncbi:serpin family protein [Cloacibacillus sp. An23]|uniref:serpin family protein n=1 Tax=Cloacibacillus sp. An23 TaxID=1965591 RepID=UPI000B37BAB1|nr:serpin family protein [Cloacibacillus sp. An23]OUO95064.1 hypothetical protein B5F39_00580 [Cloacibacillus sp. An23]
MKRTALLVMAIIALAFAPAASAETSELIPPFHWTYHSLSSLAAKGLIDNEVVPGKSAYKPEQVVAMVVTALKHAERDITKLGEQELTAMRQLAAAYRPYFKTAGYDYDAVRGDIEICAMRAGLSGADGAGYTPGEKALTAKAALAVNNFTFDLYKTAAKDKAGDNIFLSPYSVSTALAMTYAGARGVTEEEMARALHFTPDIHKGMGALIGSVNSVPEETAVVSTANAIWPAKGEKILPEFYQLVRLDYRAGLRQLDYASNPEAARKTINKWVEEKTNDKITDIIPGGALTKDTKIVLTNAVYFKAGWQEEFKASDTAPRPFWVSADKSVSVPTMTRTADRLGYAKLDGAEMIDMPYKNGRFSMLVLLPDKDSSAEELEARLSSENVEKWSAALNPARVEIFIPKFKQESSYELSTTLAGLGMASAFTPGAADFSGISGNRDFCISGVLHKTFVEVAEEGTEAAAATAVIVMRAAMPAPQETVVFRADRPFVYLIKDNETNAILFIGRYARP